MKKLQHRLMICVAAVGGALLLSACEPPLPLAEPTPAVEALVSEGFVIAAPADLQQYTTPEYYRVRTDLRRCASPLCGGYFIAAENRATTICADGQRQTECYVAGIDWSQVGEAPEGIDAHVVQGEFGQRSVLGLDGLGFLTATEAFSPLSNLAGDGLTVRVGDNGVRCVTTPCFSTDAEVLNWPFELRLSDLDTAEVEQTNEQQLAVGDALSEGSLVATGSVEVSDGQTGPGTSLVASQLYLRPSPATAGCSADQDCGVGQWCRQAEAGGRECVPFVGSGASCAGFTLPWFFERCAPDLTCDVERFIADAPGVCRSPCETSADCEESDYCATDGVCTPDGACDIPVDCQQPGNLFPQILCIGYPTCADFQGRCGVSCGEPRCIDLVGADFGPCDAVLGVGRVGDACREISGCETTEDLFETLEECEAACLP